jgi:hypothetical protein
MIGAMKNTDTTIFLMRILAIASLSLSVCSCNKSYKAVVKDRAERIDAFAAELQVLKNNLPQVSAGKPKFIAADTTTGSALPYFHIKDDNSNTAIIVTEIMDDIRQVKPEFEGDYFDFPGTALNTFQKMAHPEKGRDDGWFAHRVDRLLDSRYLIVIDFKEELEVTILDEKTFSGGLIRMNAHLYDRSRQTWLGSFRIQGIPKTGYAFAEKNHAEAAMKSDIRRNAREAACEQIDQIVEAGVGGLIEFDFDGPGLDGEPIPW